MNLLLVMLIILGISKQARFRQDKTGGDTVETAFTICQREGEIIRGSQATGNTPWSVNLPISCPTGYKVAGLHHTHPFGEPEPSKADISEAKRLGLRQLCITVPQTCVTKCQQVW